ncbi:MAG: TolB family protein [Actinomycetota bacterium]
MEPTRAAYGSPPASGLVRRAHRRRRPRVLPILLALALASGLLVDSPTAGATFPGENGDILFTSERDGNREIYRMAPDGSNQTRLTNNPAADFLPAASPDGTKIAFVSNRDGNFEIYVMNADGSNQTRLTNNPAFDFAPKFSPDGTKLVFDTDRDNNNEIYTINLDGTGLTRLTSNPAFDFEATWSATNVIAFVSDRDGNDEIYQIAPDGTGLTRLTDNPARDFAPDYLPDGTQMLFSSDRSGNNDIFIMDLPAPSSASSPFARAAFLGTPDENARNVTNDPESGSHQKASPNGKQMVYEGQTAGGGDFEVLTKPLANNVEPIPLTMEGARNGDPFWISLPPRCEIDMRIFDGQFGSLPLDADEETRGAFTVLNENDTDVSGKRDVKQSRVPGEVDLMKVELGKPTPDFGGETILTVIPNAKVKIWPTKNKASIGAGAIATPVFTRTSELPRTVWVEGIQRSDTVQDVFFQYIYAFEEIDCRDAAKATIVWSEISEIKHERSDEELWPDFPDPPFQGFLENCAGFGLRPAEPFPVGIRNCIAFQFRVFPNGIGMQPVDFDITRQTEKSIKAFNPDTGEVFIDESEKFPDGDIPNDDTGGRDKLDADEGIKPTADNFIYVFDAPGAQSPKAPEGARMEWVQDFLEFVRVGFIGGRPKGEVLAGSRASDKVLWHVRHTWKETKGRWRRTTGNKEESPPLNSIGPN